jgi:DNA polymerase III alpha subunit
MINDAYGRIGYNQEEIIEGLKKNSKLNFKDSFLMDGEQYTESCKKTYIELPKINNWVDRDNSISIEEFHKKLQNNWLVPSEYKDLDIEQVLLNKCKNEEQINRVKLELVLYKKFNLINLLRYLKYLRDIAKENNIVWGVGRGSSCSSYCLFLLEIHRVDSLFYKLDINEFLR